MDNPAEILQELQDLSKTKSSENRRQLLHRVTDLFSMTSEEQEQSHRDAFDQIMDRLAFELESSVRAEFADRLADLDNAPSNITYKLANDEIDVARPVLTRSKVLSDDFLVKVASTQSQDHLLAICDRETITPNVTDVLVERGNNEVLKNVSANTGANFSRQGFEQLAEHAVDDKELNLIFTSRKDTPGDIIDAVKVRVAEKIKNEMSNSGAEISEFELNSMIDVKSKNIAQKTEEEKAAIQEIDYLHQRKQLNERVIIHYVKLEKIPETIYALSKLTGFDQSLVEHCLLQAELPALAVLCRAQKFQRTTFASLLQMRENVNPTDQSEVVSAIRRYESLDLQTAQRVLRFLKVRNLAANEEENAPDANGNA